MILFNDFIEMAGVGAQRKTQYKSFNGFKTTNSEFEGMDLFSFKRLGGENCLKGKVLKFFLLKFSQYSHGLLSHLVTTMKLTV